MKCVQPRRACEQSDLLQWISFQWLFDRVPDIVDEDEAGGIKAAKKRKRKSAAIKSEGALGDAAGLANTSQVLPLAHNHSSRRPQHRVTAACVNWTRVRLELVICRMVTVIGLQDLEEDEDGGEGGEDTEGLEDDASEALSAKRPKPQQVPTASASKPNGTYCCAQAPEHTRMRIRSNKGHWMHLYDKS